MTGLILLMLLIGAGSFAAAGECPSLDPVRWLLAEWTSPGENRVTTESWTEVSADTFEGFVVSRVPESGEIVPIETLRLVAMSGGVFYIAKVPDNALPICFKMTVCDEQTAVFENPDHDFPRVIAYRLAADGVLTVRVTDGADEGFTVRYTRGNALASH
jgi:hypothetical protein